MCKTASACGSYAENYHLVHACQAKIVLMTFIS